MHTQIFIAIFTFCCITTATMIIVVWCFLFNKISMVKKFEVYRCNNTYAHEEKKHQNAFGSRVHGLRFTSFFDGKKTSTDSEKKKYDILNTELMIKKNNNADRETRCARSSTNVDDDDDDGDGKIETIHKHFLVLVSPCLFFNLYLSCCLSPICFFLLSLFFFSALFCSVLFYFFCSDSCVFERAQKIPINQPTIHKWMGLKWKRKKKSSLKLSLSVNQNETD